MNKIKSLFLYNKILVCILLLGVFLRTIHPLELFGYSHDQDLAGWIVRDIIENRHFRLIGQETSMQGVYIGAFWYYLLVPFYLLFNMSPVGGLVLSTVISTATIFSVWFVCRKIWSQRIGIIAALVYASSYYMVVTDREVVPTITVMLWSVWYLYSAHLLLSKKTRGGMLLTAVLFGLVWHINLALLLLIPVTLSAIIINRKNFKTKALFESVIFGILTLSPFILFEVKRNFLQTKAIIAAISGKGGSFDFIAKLDHTTALASRNVESLLWAKYIDAPVRIPLYFVIAVFLFLVFKSKIDKVWAALFSLWFFLFITFFTLNSINLSEYYLNGLTIVWIVVLALFFDFFISSKKLKFVGIVLIGLYVALNIHRFFNQSVNRSAYIERSAIVAEIAADAKLHNYPCVSVSYITSPGYELGYRYLFYLQKLHVNDPISNSPVYTIVFPHRFVNSIDKSFGAIGLIYPDYKKYNPSGVNESCSGANSNLTNPLFGYTE